MKYSIVIPTYNHCNDLLKPCIDSLLKYSKVSDIELIVSANGCKDNTLSYLTDLKEKYYSLGMTDNFKIVWSDEPLGYSKACNVGIEKATTDYIVLLNNDVVFLPQHKNQWLDLFERQFEINPKCGISCVIKGPSEPAGRDFAVFFIVMIHRKVFDKIGLLNTDYGVGGGEDTEFCIEAENAGFEVCVASDLIWNEQQQIYTGIFPVYHKGEGTMHDPELVPEWSRIFKENSLKLAKKYNIDWYNKNTNNIVSYQDKLSFMQQQHPEIFKEIITDNVYNTKREQVNDKFVIDIGANIGTFSLLAAELGAKQVYSLEPVSTTFNQLCKNINTGKYRNIVPMKNAVSNISNDFVNIGIMSDSGHNSMYKNESGQFEMVPTVTLTDLLDKCNGKVVLKIDCEGAEYDILMNMTNDSMAKVDRVVLEVHGDMHPVYKGYQILNDKMKSFGFEIEDFKQIYFWQYNEKGEQVNCKELPYRIEIWKR